MTSSSLPARLKDDMALNSQAINMWNDSSEDIPTIVIHARDTNTCDPPAIGRRSMSSLPPIETERLHQRYPFVAELGDIFMNVLKAHEILCSHAIPLPNITLKTVMTLATACNDHDHSAAAAIQPKSTVASEFLSESETTTLAHPGVSGVATNIAGPRPVEPGSSTKVVPGHIIKDGPIFFATEVLLGLRKNKKVARTTTHNLESFEWVFLYAVYERCIESASTGTYAARARVQGLLSEFRAIFAPAVDLATLATHRELLLAWPTDAHDDHFEKIRRLLSFVEHVVGSEELLCVLMDVWQDLKYRLLALYARAGPPPVRPGSFFKDAQGNFGLPREESIRCMGDRDLIKCLESIIPRPEGQNSERGGDNWADEVELLEK